MIKNTIPETWWSLCKLLGEKFLTNSKNVSMGIHQGSYEGSSIYRVEYVRGIKFEILYPDARPFSPPMPVGQEAPCTDEYIISYFNDYLLNPEVKDGEDYTYGSRIWEVINGVPQIERVMYNLRKSPMSNQHVVQVARPEDIALKDPPCLRHFQYKLNPEGKVDCHITFRSWDLWGGLCANLGGLTMLSEMVCDYAYLPIGNLICYSSGLHVYNYNMEMLLNHVNLPYSESVVEKIKGV